ncbi:MAG TPA: hypothetical protein VHZ55_10125 [Bryobacteraceae bacterium]|nr:hypothetical protein [Bryobacteraceae bacterium]
MANVVIPSKWNQKPPLGVRLNQGHPLSQGIYAAWLFNEPSGTQSRDLVQGIPMSGVSTSMVPQSPYGQSMYDSTETVASTPADPRFGSASFSAVLLRYETRTDSYGGILGVAGPSGSGNIALQWGWQASAQPFCTVAVGAKVTMQNVVKNQPNVYGVSTGPHGLYLYLNGQLNAFSTTSSTLWPYPSQAIYGFAAHTSVIGMGYMWYLYTWLGRELTPNDHAHLYADPYAIVQPQSPQRRFWTIPGTTPAQLAQTISHILPEELDRGVQAVLRHIDSVGARHSVSR